MERTGELIRPRLGEEGGLVVGLLGLRVNPRHRIRADQANLDPLPRHTLRISSAKKERR